MPDKKAELVASLAKHAEDLIRESGGSIFHDGIMNKFNLRYAENPSPSGLIFAALMRHMGYGPEHEPSPEDDKISQFYVDLNEGFYHWSAFPAVDGKSHCKTACWDQIRMQRISTAGFLFIDIPFAMLWAQKELTGEFGIANDKPDTNLGELVVLEIYQKLNATFLAEYDAAVAEHKTRLASSEEKIWVTRVPEESDGVAKLLFEPKKKDQREELDIDALNTLDLDGAAERVEEMRQGGGEVLEPSNKCDSGACEI